jgi:2-oxoglutarate ferredoxin oxidoreductase subunit delta
MNTPDRAGIVSERSDKGSVTIDASECKGCGLCIASCTPAVLRLSEHVNPYGYHSAIYAGHGCTGCGLCFFACPEPGAITVFKRAKAAAA